MRFATKLFTPIIICLLSMPVFSDQSISFDKVFISDERLDSLKERITNKVEPNYSAYLEIKKDADANLDREPHVLKDWYVPGYYVDAEGHKTAKGNLEGDANTAYKQALVYHITGQDQYAKAAIRLINAWSTGVESVSMKDDSTLSFSYHFPSMIFAADLLKESELWPKDEQKQFEAFLMDTALQLNTMNRKNNWGNWGMVLYMGIAAYVNDNAMMQKGIERWKEFIQQQISPDGHLHHEVNRNNGRSGVWYTHFSLFPQTIAAEIARVNGVNLYDYKTINGKSLRDAYEWIIPWVQNPQKFPYLKDKSRSVHGAHYISYFEILNQRWPNPTAAKMLEKHRPLDASHSAPAMTFTHGDLLNP